MNNILIIGKPNSGKSLLFNRLTGMNQKVSNFPGVTVDVKTGKDETFTYQDFPGIYSLNPLTTDEEISTKEFKKALKKDELKAVVCTLDATRLERSLVLGLQVQSEARAANKPVLFALNMMDEINAHHMKIDFSELEKKLQSPILGISAKKQTGLEQFKSKLEEISKHPELYLSSKRRLDDEQSRSLAKEICAEFTPESDEFLKTQQKLDRLFLSSKTGFFFFFAIMVFLFQSIFTWAAPLMDMTEELVALASTWTLKILPDGIISHFVDEAFFGGLGSFLVFVPQIFMLTLIIGLLEDSGYLARATTLCHRPLNFFGLSGKSFVPLLSGHACSIPAIMAARTIESPKKRLLTILAIPLMSCSARLPVYGLLVAVLIPDKTYLGGLIGWQGLAFFALFFLGIATAMIISFVLSRTTLKTHSDAPFIIELPPYRLPAFAPLLQRSLASSWSFVSKAGGIIFTVSVVVWVLGYFPNGQGQLQTSWLASIGQVFEPVFSPLGIDWKFGVAILASFLAREVFVGTLGTMVGIEGADEDSAGLSEYMIASGFTLASGASLLVFYVVALQCVSTLAVIKQETGSKLMPVATFVGYSLLAYVMALLTYTFMA